MQDYKKKVSWLLINLSKYGHRVFTFKQVCIFRCDRVEVKYWVYGAYILWHSFSKI